MAIVGKGVVVEDVRDLEVTVVSRPRWEMTDSAEGRGREGLSLCEDLVGFPVGLDRLCDLVLEEVVGLEAQLFRVNAQIDQFLGVWIGFG